MAASPEHVRELQEPLKDRYRDDAAAALLTLTAEAHEGDSALACSVDLGRALYEAQAHAGVGGAGTAVCSGDLLLGALAACAQITCQMVANAAGITVNHVGVRVEGDLDLRGALGLNPRIPVGFSKLRIHFDLDAPDATERQVAVLQRLTEQACVVLQTLMVPPQIEAYWKQGPDAGPA